MATDKKCRFPQKQVEQGLEQAVKSTDPARAKAFLTLQRVRATKAKVQQREQLRLSEKLGSDSPRVLALQAKVAANQKLAYNLKLEAARAEIELPEINEQSWSVHGRVLNRQGDPVPGMNIALYDRGGCPIQACGKEITDKKGYFKLLINNLADGSSAAAGIDQKQGTVGFVHVMDRDNVTVHEDKRPLPIKMGESQYLEIILDDDGGASDTPGGKPPATTTTRFLGNSSSRELHDLENQQPGCRIGDIKYDHKVNFESEKEALALGYDYCAYCFGKEKSKR